MTRALIVVRLSRMSDTTTSPERQLEKCRELCDQRGYEVVGVAQDLDVSAGSTSPFDRPSLRKWIGNGKDNPGKVHEFDVIVFYRVDRVVRRVKHLGKLIDWSEDHSVNLVSATETHFDLSTPIGRVIAQLVASFAEMELEAISERAASAARHNIKAGKWRGGTPPWGYKPSDETGEWRLVQDPQQVEVIQEVVRRVLDGEPLRAVAHDLTARGVLTPRDRFAQLQGREVKDYDWHSGPLKRALLSKAMLGHAMSNGESVWNEDGSPVVRSEPILRREVFDRLGVELAERENRKEPTKCSTALLLQVIHCGVCGRPAYKLKGGPGRKPRYRCASANYKETCGNKSVPLPDADEGVERLILGLLGSSERLERVWDSGSDHSAELAEINDELTDLAGQIGTPAFRAGTPQREKLEHRIAQLAARQEELSAEAVKPAGWTWQPTGEKFADWWERRDITAKNVWLRSMNVRLEFEDGRFNVILGDVFALTEQMKADGPVVGYQDLLSAMKGSGVEGIEINGDDVRFTLDGGVTTPTMDINEWLAAMSQEA